MNTDLSDEALKTWLWNYSKVYAQPPDMATVWDACRLRAEAMIEERERAAFEWAWRQRPDCQHGYPGRQDAIEEAYSAFKEQK